ncbi:MAG: alpha/beta fold hydrolase [Beijerinckiaceae bacterium]
MSDVKDYFETVEGCRTHVMRAGKGQPLLYLHGANGGRWLPFLDELAKNFDVITPEHPGFGLSDTPGWLDNVGDLAHFYLEFMEKLGLDKVVLAGTSLGGWTACEIAVRSTQRLDRMVLAAPAGIHVKGVQKGDLFLWSPEQTVRNLFHSPELQERMLAMPMSDEDRDIALRNRFTKAKLAWQPRLYNPDLEKWLHRIKVPVLILWGRQDKLIPAAYGERFNALIPGSVLKVFDECGHLPHAEKSAEYVAAIREFAKG